MIQIKKFWTLLFYDLLIIEIIMKDVHQEHGVTKKMKEKKNYCQMKIISTLVELLHLQVLIE